jgi:hypothetical protein
MIQVCLRVITESDASLVCRARIEDHGLLADLYFAVLEAAGALVHVQDSTGTGLLCIDKPEAARDCAFAEQALAGADDHRELPNAKRVDKIVLEQGLEEAAAAMDLNLATWPYLELRDLVGYVALEQARIVPVEFIKRPRSDELRPGVEGRSDFVRRVGGLGPGSCEDLKAPARLVHSVIISPNFSSK